VGKKLILGILIVVLVFCGCARQSTKENTPSSNTIPIPPPSILAPASTPTSTSAPSVTPVPRVVRPAIRSVDLVAFQSPRNGTWFSTNLDTLPDVDQQYEASFNIQDTPVNNRRNGTISPTLLAGYFFLQWDITKDKFQEYANTVNALFIRSANSRFVNYPDSTVFDWSQKASKISTDVVGIIRACNEKGIPVFVQINYSDFIPGPTSSGIESLQPSDNLAKIIAYINALKSESLRITGITFGDEIEDNQGYGNLQPTLYNDDLIARFIKYADNIKTEFPEVKIYAFDSYIMASRAQVSRYFDFFERIRKAEIQVAKVLLDGFVFRESYVYMDDGGKVLDSQLILDDTESLYRNMPVYRYDVSGTRNPAQDSGYLPLLLARTKEIFGRELDIGITEYLPAGAYKVSETNTSKYSDVDFIIHFSDMVGIYAELGLDYLSKIMFADSLNMHKAYFDRKGNLGVNFPVHEQLAQNFMGELLNVERSIDYDHLKVKVYATRKDKNYFVMILNKDVGSESVIRVTLPGQLDLTLRLPRRSYVSLLINERDIVICGIGN